MKTIVNNVTAGLAYFVGAYVGLLLALPPSNASPIWPPAGIALALLIIHGNRVLPGLIIGAFAAQLYSYVDTSSSDAIIRSMLIGFIIGCGSVLQAFTGKWLTDKFVGHEDPLIEDNKILMFLAMGGPISCVVAATVGVTIITVANIITANEYLLTWLTWWVGDSIGVLVLTPMILIYFARPREIWRQRINTVFFPLCLILASMILLFQYGKYQDVKRIGFQNDQHVNFSDELKTLFQTTKRIVTEDEFIEYTNHQLRQTNSIQALEWIPRIKDEVRQEFEKEWIGPDSIRQSDKNNILITADKRAEYFPIRYINPLNGNTRASGFDISTNQVAFSAIQKARDTGEPAMTGPIQLVQDEKDHIGTVIYTPIYSTFTKPVTIEERREQFLGIIACVTYVDDIVNSVFQIRGQLPVNINIRDGGNILFERLLDKERHNMALIDLTKELRIMVADRDWIVTYTPSIEFFKANLYWHTWWVILIGMIFTAMAGAGLFMLTGRTLRTEMIVRDRTTDLEKEVTERKQAEELITEMNLALANAMPGISKLDASGCYVSLNEEYARLLGYTIEELIGKHWEITVHPDNGEHARVAYERMLKEGKSEYEGLALCKDGNSFHKSVLMVKIVDKDGKFIGHHCFMRDISERKQVESLLTFQATHDALTGLVNRNEFEHRVERVLSSVQQNGEEHALFFMDLDQFKIVNDTCGHIGGDELLRQVSTLLKETVRKRDTLARLGGDEFGVLMEHCSLEDAYRAANSILKVIEDFQFNWEDSSFRIGISIGLVAITEDINNLSEVLKRADIACYTAKEKGRNRIHEYHTEDTDTADLRGNMQWVERINSALEENRFSLYAQLIEPLGPGKEKIYELLIRLVDKNGEHIKPALFLPAAERYNLMLKIDHWVIKNALQLLIKHPLFLDDIDFISVNLSGQSLVDVSYVNSVINELTSTGISGNKICFEITETAVISNLNKANEFIATLKRYGCQFALDDFGSGLSSFGYLKHLAVDYLKIDGMFVRDMITDPIDFAMVKSIHDIGEVMGIKTIAEFVENTEIKSKLSEIGVNYVQGFEIGNPVSFEELLVNYQNEVIN